MAGVTGLGTGRGGAQDGSTGLPTGERRPALFVHLGELAAVRRRVLAGDDPWASAFETFAADVRESLTATPRSVTDSGGSTFRSGDPGSGESARADYTAAIEMGDRVRDLGLAYQFTGEDRYAERTVAFLDHWFLDPETRMEPRLTNGIELYVTIPKLWYGADLVRNHDAWDDGSVGSHAALEEWTDTFLSTIPTATPDWVQNIFVWRETCRAAGAAYLGDDGRLREAFDRIRADGFRQRREDWLLANELQRSEGLSYSLYALKAFVTAAELGRHYGEDLYGYERDGEPALRRLFEAHVPFFFDPEAFDERFGEVGGFAAREREEGTSAYELAYSQWEDESFLRVVRSRGSEVRNEPTYVEQHQDAIDSRGRPVRDERLLGWTTLTHANRFDLGAGDASDRLSGQTGR